MKPRTNKHPDTGKVTRSKVIRAGVGCCNKMAYTSRKMSGEKIEAYRCVKGGHCWHVGHPIGSRSRRAS